MSSLDDEIRSKTETFAKDLAVLVRRAALEAAAAALGAGGSTAPPVQVAAKRGRGRPRKAATPVPAAKAAAAPKRAKATPASKASVSRKSAPMKRPSGPKRAPGELAKLTEKLGEYIKAHPGLRMEAIGKALGAPTKDLNLPVKKLLAARKIRTEGEKRATEYFLA